MSGELDIPYLRDLILDHIQDRYIYHPIFRYLAIEDSESDEMIRTYGFLHCLESGLLDPDDIL